jgi:membrane protein YdbS with pleckstrin-like domain
LRVFHAGRNYFRLRIARWAMVELAALGGLIFWTFFLIEIGRVMRDEKLAPANRTAPAAAATTEVLRMDDSATASVGTDQLQQNRLEQTKENLGTAGAEKKHRRKASKNWKYENSWDGFRHACADFALRLPAGAFALIWIIKIFSALVFFVQLPITYAVRRLDYEMRWYMVTDRSLRLRYGVWRICESTMSFANVQQVVVSQGPLQRLLGLGDVKVKSAGGGGGSGHHNHHESDDMHTGLFHSVTNAAEIRDLILERLRRFREAGLGDPDEKIASTVQADKSSGEFSVDALAAARELAAEARALRTALNPAQ